MAELNVCMSRLVSIGQWAGEASLSAAILALAMFLIQAVMGRWLTPAWRYRLWALVALRLMMPVLPAVPAGLNPGWQMLSRAAHRFATVVPRRGEVEAAQTSRQSTTNLSVSVAYDPPPLLDGFAPPGSRGAQGTSEQSAPGSRWIRAMTGTWLLVVLLLLGRLIIVNLRLNRRLRHATAVTDPAVLATLEECRRMARVRRATPLFVSNAVRIPAAAGVWRTRILVPPRMLDALTLDEQRVVFLHELSHIRCHDVAINWVLAALQILHWFNPIVAAAFSRLRAEREVARDAMVLASESPDRVRDWVDRYGGVLLKFTESVSRFPDGAASYVGLAGMISWHRSDFAGLFAARPGLSWRLKMIERLSNSTRGRYVLGPILALFVGAVALTRAQEPAPIPPVHPSTVPAAPRGGETRPSVDVQRVEPASQPVVLLSNRDRAAQKALDRILPQAQFEKVALTDVIDFFRDVSGANIFVNWHALAEAGVSKNTLTSLRLTNVKLSKALTLMLDSISPPKVRIGYVIDDGIIYISAGKDLDRTETRVYDVRDLIVDVPDFSPATQPSVPAAPSRDDRVKQLIKMLEEMVAPQSWKDAGGTAGAIREISGQLVIAQTPENLASISAILAQIRDYRTQQIYIAARFISCDAQLYQQLLAGWRKSRVPTAPAAGAAAGPDAGFLLNDEQVAQLIRAVQSSPDAAILAAPRLTTFNGQRAYVSLSSDSSYIRDYTTTRLPDGQKRFEPVRGEANQEMVLDVRATVSADQRSASLSLRPKISVLRGVLQKPWPGRPEGSSLVIEEPQIKTTELQATVNLAWSNTLLLGGMEDPGIQARINPNATTAPATPSSAPRYLFLLVKPSIVRPTDVPDPRYPRLTTRPSG